MTQPSGWYDDPQDPSQLRYWDGVVWSSHVTPKVSPSVEQSNIGMPYGVAPASSRPQSAGSEGAKGAPTPPGFHPPGRSHDQGPHGQGPQDQGPQDQGPQQYGHGQQYGQWPAYGQAPGPLGQQPPGWASHLPTTPDGVLLSGWWKRVLARLIDSVIIWFVALPLTFLPLQQVATVFGDYLGKVMDAIQAGSATMPAEPGAELNGPLLQVSLTILAVYVIYEVALLTRTGATLGKRIVGISVRLRDQPGPPPLVAVLKRTAVKEVGGVVGSLPGIGILGSVFSLLDVLWPLWDDKKQAIHDKVGATNVVVGPQPKREV